MFFIRYTTKQNKAGLSFVRGRAVIKNCQLFNETLSYISSFFDKTNFTLIIHKGVQNEKDK